ncbi:MAG: MotA/TolQ/ExbB proton channel family protein [Verrucomicrobia bacterium]|nr:MotA/TolQ/ExbB proton channel family protein [Verrucomicrobiota bacterium]
MKKWGLLTLMMGVLVCLLVVPVMAQDVAPAPTAAAPKATQSGGFFSVVTGSGFLGGFLWLTIFAAAGAAVYFAVDCGITVRSSRIMPEGLVATVNEAMAEGDVLKALQFCENEPGPLANVLTAGFSHVEEGFDVIQEAVATSADLETEKIMQKLTWLAVVGNLAPMLGLLGTVQGMIAAFSNLAGGTPDVGLLAMNISQALYTTAGGLIIAVPCVAVFYAFRNMANMIVLKMEAMTMELIKDLRNVEVVED